MNLLVSGLSITVMKVDEAILPLLDAPTKAPAWPVGVDGMFYYYVLKCYFLFLIIEKVIEAEIL